MSLSLIVFHVQSPTGAPIPKALAKATGGPGPWAAMGNDCGDIFTSLSPGHYDVTFSAAGFADRVLAADLSDCGVITVGLEYAAPSFQPAPREWKGQMCGLRVAGLPPVPGGAADSSLLLSWFYDRYDPSWRARIRRQMQDRGYTHWLLSWPDSRSVGATPETFRALCQELIADGFFPCVMLTSKDYDPADVPTILAGLQPLLAQLVGLVPMFCIGWELSLWLSPTQVQQLIDAIALVVFAQTGTLLYVHFAQRVFSWQENGKSTADFWKANVGKLTGILAQKELLMDDAAFLDWIHDCLTRCAGNFFMPTDSGFGHPFDFVALEISAQQQFNGQMTEAEGDRLGQVAINAPAETGPAGTVHVQGSGNGL